MISGLRPLFPLWCLRHHLSPAKAGAQQPVLHLEPLMNTKVRGALLSHRLRGEGGGASHQRGAAAVRRHLYWRRKAPTSPAERYYITPEGGALNPSGRRSRSRTEPLAPRAAGPAAPSTLAAKPRQPSGIQPSAAISPQSPSPQISHTAKKH